MKGLWKYISPFAPDQSGVCSVLYDLGGIIVICDAGGCAGNVCGFDEPRWFGKKSAIFSAGLRDMDAILGRDDKLIEKLCMSLAGARSQGAKVQVVYSPIDAYVYAKDHADEDVTFLAVGFETTTPASCLAVRKASEDGLKNFSILTANKTMPNAYQALKGSADAFLYPGHVHADWLRSQGGFYVQPARPGYDSYGAGADPHEEQRFFPGGYDGHRLQGHRLRRSRRSYAGPGLCRTGYHRRPGKAEGKGRL